MLVDRVSPREEEDLGDCQSNDWNDYKDTDEKEERVLSIADRKAAIPLRESDWKLSRWVPESIVKQVEEDM